MYKILNKFLNTKFFDILPKFIARKFFKIFKIFFVETKLKYLPDHNHPTEIDKNQLDIINNIKNNFYRPFSTCSYLLELLTFYQSLSDKKIKFLDFGANNLDNYIYLNRYLKNWEYIYHDLESYNKYIYSFIKERKLENISVLNNFNSLEEELDFVFFGSSIHYINNYREIIEKICKAKSKYLIFSHTPFYKRDNNDKDIVMKQVNIHPIINYAYLIEYENFVKFMRKNNYEIISQNKNNFIKFLNFKNFRGYRFISFLDLFFKRVK